jgi:hypothetical protein
MGKGVAGPAQLQLPGCKFASRQQVHALAQKRRFGRFLERSGLRVPPARPETGALDPSGPLTLEPKILVRTMAQDAGNREVILNAS